LKADTTIPTTSRVTHGYLIALAGTAFWSCTAIFIRYLTETYRLPPLILAFWRDAAVSLALVIAFMIVAPPLLHVDRRHLWFLFVYGFVLSVFNSLWTVSVALNGAAVATVLAYSSPAFTAVLAWWLLRERFDRIKAVAVLLSIAGCTLISGAYSPSAWQVNPLGIATGLLTGVLFAGYSLMGKVSSRRDINPWTATLYTFACASVFVLVYIVVPGWLPGALPPPSLMWLGSSLVGWGTLIVLAIGPTLGGFGLYTVSLTYLPASVANLICTLEPAMTAVLAYLFLSERLTTPQWIGSALIIACVVMLRMGEGRAPAQSALASA
jgi:DME family drug/metabolite transporter